MMERCRNCGLYFRPKTRRQQYCVNCTHKFGPDLIIDEGSYHAELYSDLIPTKRLIKLRRLLKRK